MMLPIAKKIPHVNTYHGREHPDDYDWLRDRGWPNVTDKAVLDYLNLENAYADSILDPLKPLQEKLYQELRGRIQEADDSYPVDQDGYRYFTRSLEGKDYAQHCRYTLTGAIETLLDENELAAGKAYFSLGCARISPNHQLLAYSEDHDGSERYTLHIKNLETITLLPDVLENTFGGVVWNADQSGFYYMLVDAENWRKNKVYFHKVGASQTDDALIYEELDQKFHTSISRSSDRTKMFIHTGNSDMNETHVVDLAGVAAPVCCITRQLGHLYDVDYGDGIYVIKTNDKGRNFRLVTTTTLPLNLNNVVELQTARDDTYIEDFFIHENYFVMNLRTNGLNTVKLIHRQTAKETTIHFDEESYVADIIFTHYRDKDLRLSYTSMTTPPQVILYDYVSGDRRVVKEKPVLGGFDRNHYVTKRLWATSPDGVSVPYTMCYHKDHLNPDGNPVFLYGYGSYGHPIDPAFNANYLSLMDRGFVVVLGHIRGGTDLGYSWYEQAKFTNKRKTFDDFIAIADDLIERKLTHKGHITICGGSAGGMLMGACVNQRPDLYRCVMALVPFVDVLNTMFDDSLPLTPGEFSEWGNPKDKAIYDYMLTYSPYDNVVAQNYPHMYVSAGLNDPRVTYWEPAKWVARLRDRKTDNNTLLLLTEMGAGHGGPSGRFEYLKDIAKRYAFMMQCYG